MNLKVDNIDIANSWDDYSQVQNNFVNSICHEYRTPLNAIIGFSNLLLDNDEYVNKKEMLECIKSSGHQLLRYLDDRIFLTQLKEGLYTGNKKAYNLSQFARELIENYKDNFKLSTVINYHARSVDFMTDGYLLEKILNSLLNLSVKFSPKGSVTIDFTCIDDSLIIILESKGLKMDVALFQNSMKKDKRFYSDSGFDFMFIQSCLEQLSGAINVFSKKSSGNFILVKIPVME